MSDLADLYEADFVRWSEEQASAVRSAALSGANLPLDWENLAEEIDSLGKSLRSELRDRLATIVEHLLKLQVSPATDPRGGWIEKIERERIDVDILLRENSSLRATLAETIADAVDKAKGSAAASLKRYGEWTADVRRAVEEANFSREEVLVVELGISSGE